MVLRKDASSPRPGHRTLAQLITRLVPAVAMDEHWKLLEATSATNGLHLAAGSVFISRRSRPALQITISPFCGKIDSPQPIKAVAFIVDPSQRQRPAQDILRILFGLTPAECRVALLLADGRSPREIAESVGVSFETVRSQIKSIFSKTNVKRQGELIRLLLDNSVVGIRPNN